MRIEYDEAKRQRTLDERGLDFANAGAVFEGTYFTRISDRRNYGELRLHTIGMLDGILISMIWTERGDARRIISLRKAHVSERQIFQRAVDRSG